MTGPELATFAEEVNGHDRRHAPLPLNSARRRLNTDSRTTPLRTIPRSEWSRTSNATHLILHNHGTDSGTPQLIQGQLIVCIPRLIEVSVEIP